MVDASWALEAERSRFGRLLAHSQATELITDSLMMLDVDHLVDRRERGRGREGERDERLETRESETRESETRERRER